MKIWNWLISGCIFLSLFFHGGGKTNEKLMIIAADHYVVESSRPDTIMHSRYCLVTFRGTRIGCVLASGMLLRSRHI